ncbi:beta strand repeat-containing protein, partial [Frateuria sp. GZRR35]|uniref:beta strand repeat-containing protein n=1 Tax=Frateuria sp. GZRR35 TaxID=3351536 RepID=UPI003EDBE2A3
VNGSVASNGQALSLSGGALALNGAVNSGAGTTTLTASGAITEGTHGVLTAATLSGSATGAAMLTGANQVGALGNFSANGFSLTNARALTVAGAVNGGASGVMLITTDGKLTVNGGVNGGTVNLHSAGDLTLNAGVNSGSGTTTLTSAGAIDEGSSGEITAGKLTGTSAGATTLDGANRIGALESFGANGFILTNAQALAVAGTVNGGNGTTGITTTAGALTVHANVAGASVVLTGQAGLGINGHVDSGAGSTSLNSGGTIEEGASGLITAGTLNGSADGAVALDGTNAIVSLGDFSSKGFSLENAQALTVAGTVNGGSGATRLATTTGTLTVGGSIAGGSVNLDSGSSLAIDGRVNSGSGTTTLTSRDAISEGSSGVVTAGTLLGNASGAAVLGGANQIGNLGGFSANGISVTNAQALTVTGAVNSGSGATSLATTAGALTINGNVAGSAVALDGRSDLAINAGVNSGTGMTTLRSGGAISEGAKGAVTAGVLTGQSVGSTTLDPANMIGTLDDFTANGFYLLNGQSLAVAGSVDGGSGIALQTTSGDMTIAGALSADLVTLKSAGAIDGGAAGSIFAATLTGSAGGPTRLGTSLQFMDNRVGTLGGFSSPAGFSFTNGQTLTLASVGGSAYTVNAGTAELYLGVHDGDLLQQGTNWLYNGSGTWSSTGRIGTSNAPIYVTGVSNQVVSGIGLPPAYFYAVDARGNPLPVIGGPSVNVPTSVLTSRAQNGNHGDAYIDSGVITANYRSFGIVPSGILLPTDQQACDPEMEECDE